MSLLKTKLDEYLGGTEHFFASQKKVKDYIDYRLGFIEKEIADKLPKLKKEEIPAYQVDIDKKTSSLEMLKEHLRQGEQLAFSLLDTLEEMEKEKALMAKEIQRLQSKVQQERYGRQEQKPMTYSERMEATTAQYKKWSDHY